MAVEKKIILITGANRGIGLGFVTAYLQRNYKVIATCRTPEHATHLIELAKQYPVDLMIEKLDVISAEDFKQLAKKYEHSVIDILINNAGIFPEDHSKLGIAASDPKSVLQAFEVNSVGALMAIQALQGILIKSKNPRIINMSSQMGSLQAAKGSSYAYRMSKAAVNMLTRCFAAENQYIITVALRPGWVKTQMGGTNADISIEESVAKMIHIIENLQTADSGSFFDNEKNHCHW